MGLPLAIPIAMAVLSAVQIGKGIYDTAQANKEARKLRKKLEDSKTPSEYGSTYTSARQRADSMGELDRASRERELETSRVGAMSQIRSSSGSPASKMAASMALNRGVEEGSTRSFMENLRMREGLHRYADSLALQKGAADMQTERFNNQKLMTQFGMVDRQMEAGSQAISSGISNAIGSLYYGMKDVDAKPGDTTMVENPDTNALNTAISPEEAQKVGAEQLNLTSKSPSQYYRDQQMGKAPFDDSFSNFQKKEHRKVMMEYDENYRQKNWASALQQEGPSESEALAKGPTEMATKAANLTGLKNLNRNYSEETIQQAYQKKPASISDELFEKLVKNPDRIDALIEEGNMEGEGVQEYLVWMREELKEKAIIDKKRFNKL